MPDIPSPLTYSTVVGKFTTIFADSADAGDAPDLETLTGTATVTATIPRVFIAGSPSQTAFTTVARGLIVAGQILGPDGVTPLRVLATNSPGINPTSFQYVAVFNFNGVSQQPDPVTFNAPGGATVDLSALLSVVVSPAIQTTVSEQTRIDAQAAATAAAASAVLAASYTGGGGTGVWGGITGTLSSQTDLSNALGGKAPTVHTHTAAQLSDSTTTGRAVITATDAAAARTAIGAASSADARLTDARAPLAHTSALVTDFTEAAQDAIATMLAGASGVTLSYNDTANTLTITGGGAGGLDSEAVRDAMGVALVGAGVITVLVNDAADTITITSAATANATDAALRDRGTHTGAQPSTTISDFVEAVQDVVGGFISATSGTGVAVTYNDSGNAETFAGPLVAGLLPLAAMPPGATITVVGATRTSARTDLKYVFINAADVPIVLPPSLAGMYDGDVQIKTA